MNLFTALKYDFSVYVTKKLWIKWQTNIAHFDRTQVMKMHNNNIEGKIYYSVIDWTSSIAIAATCFPSFPFWSPFVHSLENHDLGLQYTISQLPLLTASSTSSPIIAAATPILFKCSTWSFMMAINGVTQSYCLHSNARFIRGKSWKIRLFPKPVGEIVKTSILPFPGSSRLATTFWKSLSAVFVASSNSAWRDVESVITATSHFLKW